MLAASSPGTYRLNLFAAVAQSQPRQRGGPAHRLEFGTDFCSCDRHDRGRPRSLAIAATKRRVDFAPRYREDISLKDAALKLGYLTAVQFGPMGAARGHDASGVTVAAGRGIAFRRFKNQRRDGAPLDQRLPLRAPPANAARQAGLR
jgi:hypothetical protein